MTSLTPRCGLCSSKDHLLRCSGCKVMPYCSKEHQVAHRNDHKLACNAVRHARDHLKREEDALRANPGDGFMLPADVFNTQVGHFWGIFGTRDYMRARHAFVTALGKIKTFDAAQTALDHVMDILRLNRGDNMAVRDAVPALLLRLGRDQDCYDFVKWWQTAGQKSDFDWGDMSLPFLNLKNEDAFESVEYLCGRWRSISHVSAITLLKIKLLLDLKSLRNSAFLDDQVPREIVDNIQRFVPQSSIILTKKKMMDRSSCVSHIAKLSSQVDQLYATVETSNKHFWPALLNPKKHLNTRVDMYSPGSLQEAQLILQQSIDSWIEIPGVLDIIKAKAK